MLTHLRAPAPPTRTIVLGCRGFVGSTIVARLGERGWDVEGISSEEIDLTADGAGAALAGRLRDDDALVVVSALTPDRGKDALTLERNIRMGRAVVEALGEQSVGHVLYMGSDAVYADDANPVRESACASPDSLYGVMHLARELMLSDACARAQAPLVILRPTLLYGPGDTHNAYGPNRYLRTAQEDGRIALFGEGEERRDHVFVQDLAALVELVLERRSTGVLNVATGTSSSFREVAETVADLLEGDVAIEGSPRQNPVTHRHFDLAQTRAAFPTFRWTPLHEGLERTLGR